LNKVLGKAFLCAARAKPFGGFVLRNGNQQSPKVIAVLDLLIQKNRHLSKVSVARLWAHQQAPMES
jgi:hypothetical protein